MRHANCVRILALGCVLTIAAGCASFSKRSYLHQGESLVLAGEEPAQLAFPPLLSQPVVVRNTYLDCSNTICYRAGVDYLVNSAGQIQRTPGSRIPDFRTNMLYGQEHFDHSKFPGFGNSRFFVYVDYRSPATFTWARNPAAIGTDCLKATCHKLRAGGPLKIVVFGDSISTGCDVSAPALVFWQRWVEELRQAHPRARIELINGATGGDSTRQGLQRLEEKVLNQQPDLVLLGFGMNDHNVGPYGVPLPEFSANLEALIDRIRLRTGAEIILYSTFPPNPKWAFGSHNMGAYARATEQVARARHCAFADVYRPWTTIAARKKPEDLLANNINHPNDFGHWIYLQALRAIGL